MISVDQISDAVSRYVAGIDTRAAFEDWFSGESWNAHRYASERLMNLIADIEALFSRLHYEGLTEPEFRRELGSTMDPFERRSRVLVGSERTGLSYRLVVPDSNVFVAAFDGGNVVLQIVEPQEIGHEVLVRKLPVEEPWQSQIEATSLVGIPYWLPASLDARQG